MVQITAFGDIVVDMIKQQHNTFTRQAGGSSANFAVACSRLGYDTDLIAKVGDDFLGDFLQEKLVEENVSLETDPAEKNTTVVLIQLDDEGIPSFLPYKQHCADTEITEDDIDIDSLRETDILHFTSLSLLTDPIRGTLGHVLKQLDDTTISFDPNIRRRLWDKDLRQAIEQILPHVDILLCADDELQLLIDGDSIRDRVENGIGQYGFDEIIVTKGADGAEYHSQAETIHIDSYDTDVVDTTGAGDAFAAGYLTSYIDGREPRQRLRNATVTASFCIEQHGAMTPLPDREQVHRRRQGWQKDF